jgi:hypothetical protein
VCEVDGVASEPQLTGLSVEPATLRLREDGAHTKIRNTMTNKKLLHYIIEIISEPDTVHFRYIHLFPEMQKTKLPLFRFFKKL